MKHVYVVLKEYHNNVAVVEQVFSSKEKAEAHVAWIIESAKKDGWTVSNQYRFMRAAKAFCVQIDSPSGRHESLERFYILKEPVA